MYLRHEKPELNLSEAERMGTPFRRKQYGVMYIPVSWLHEDKGKHFDLLSNPRRHSFSIDPPICVLCRVSTMENRGNRRL